MHRPVLVRNYPGHPKIQEVSFLLEVCSTLTVIVKYVYATQKLLYQTRSQKYKGNFFAYMGKSIALVIFPFCGLLTTLLI